VSGFCFALSIQFPVNISQLFDIVSWVNFSALSLGSPQCYTRFDYVDRMLVQTITPVIVLAIAGVSYGVHFGAFMCSPSTQSEPFPHRVTRRYVVFVLFLTYLVLPGVSTTIFRMLQPCVSVDPDKLFPDLATFHRSDYSIPCNSARYQFGRGWAAGMIIVYPVGITALYALLLLANKHVIKRKPTNSKKTFMERLEEMVNKGRQEKSKRSAGPKEDVRIKIEHENKANESIQVIGGKGKGKDNGHDNGVDEVAMPSEECCPELLCVTTECAGMCVAGCPECCPAPCPPDCVSCLYGISQHITADEITFLHKQYEPGYWYWEVVETIRRLLLTAVIAIVDTGTYFYASVLHCNRFNHHSVSDIFISSHCVTLLTIKVYL
jgi:hypothetical protein